MEEVNYTMQGVNKPEGEQTNSFYKDIVASGPVPVLVVSAGDYKVVYCNQQFETVTGYTCERMQQEDLSFYNILGEAQYAKFNNQVETVTQFAQSRTKFVSYNIRTSEGRFKLCYIYAAPVEDSEGRVAYYHLSILPELSEKPMPFMSFDSRELFLAQFNKLGFGTFEWILATNDVIWSEGVYEIYEIEKTKDLKREEIRMFTHPEDKERADKYINDALEHGKDYDFEMKIITKNKKVKMINATGTVIYDDQQKPVKLIGSIRDITSQRAAE